MNSKYCLARNNKKGKIHIYINSQDPSHFTTQIDSNSISSENNIKQKLIQNLTFLGFTFSNLTVFSGREVMRMIIVAYFEYKYDESYAFRNCISCLSFNPENHNHQFESLQRWVKAEAKPRLPSGKQREHMGQEGRADHSSRNPDVFWEISIIPLGQTAGKK